MRTLRFLRQLRPVPCVLGAALFVAVPAEAGSTLAPTAPLVGDGKTTATLQVLTEDASARVRVKADRGRVGLVTPIGGGALVEFVPPQVTEPTTLELQIQIRGATSEDIVAKIEVYPPFTQAGFDIVFDPPVFSTEGGSVKVVPKGRSPQPDANRRLKLVTSAGVLTELVPSGGAWLAHYTPPAGLKDPLQPAFVVVDLAAPSEAVGAAVGQVAVSRSLTFDAAPDSNNVLKIGLREWGPVKASPSGKVAFLVDVGPATRKGQLISVAPTGVRQVLDVDLPMTVAPALAIATLPTAAPGGSLLPVLVVCQKADGIACAVSDVQITAAQGTLGAVALGPAGTMRAEWTLPASGAAALTVVQGASKATSTVQAVGGNVTVSVSASPPALPAGKKDFAVTAHVKDSRGTAVVGRPPTFAAEGATASGKPKDNADGSYTQLYKATAPSATVRVSPPLAASGLAARQIVAWAERPTVFADGASTIPVVIAVEDALGMPVAGVELALAVPQGDGSVPPTAKTGPDGLARVNYRVGSAPGPVVIAVEGAGLKAATSIWQAPVGGAAPDVRVTGSPSYVQAQERWRAAAPSITIGPEVVGAVATTAAAPIVAAPPTMTAAAVPAELAAEPGEPGAPKAPRAPKPAGGQPWARVRGTIVNAPTSYKATLDDAAADYAQEASFALSPAFGGMGIEAQAEAFFGGSPFGADVRIGLLGWRVSINEEGYTHAGVEGHVAFRYKAWAQEDLGAYATAGVERFSTVGFAYTSDEKIAAEMVGLPVLGGRIGGGFRFERGGLLVNLELAETLVPLPVHSRADLQVDVPLGADGLALTLGAGLDARHARFAIGDGIMKVRQTGWDVSVGVGYLAF